MNRRPFGVAHLETDMGKDLKDRGKDSEKAVLAALEKMNDASVGFAFERLPDARSARGRIKKQISDFIVMKDGYFHPLEVKETEHNYRLAKDKLDQLPRLKKWARAGSKPLVLVHHSSLDVWRTVPFELLAATPLPPSWDLSELRTYPTAEAALKAALLV